MADEPTGRNDRIRKIKDRYQTVIASGHVPRAKTADEKDALNSVLLADDFRRQYDKNVARIRMEEKERLKRVAEMMGVMTTLRDEDIGQL